MKLHERKGPFADSYIGAAALVIFGLIPYLVLTSAISPLEETVSRSVGISAQTLSLTSGMANAGYAFGTVLAVQLALRTRPRRLLLLYSTLLLIGSILAASSPTPGLFIAGHIVQGFCTSLMLIAALPPLILGYPVSKLPITAGLMNLCIFGAVALGPVVGGVLAGSGDWRLLFWLASGAAAMAWLLVLLTWEDDEPMGSHPWDPASIMLAGFGTSAAFFGASELTTHAMLSPIVIIPLLGGIAAIIGLVVRQVTARNPLVPVLNLISAKPIFGVIAAIAAGASSIPAISLASEAIAKSGAPGHLASLFWPFFGMAIVVALLFGLVLNTRMLVPLVVAGLTVLSGGIVVLTGVQHGPHELVAFGSGMVGFGVGASVAPALFVAGYSVRVIYIQRVLALVELFRAVAAFMTGPILLHLAMTVDGGLAGSGLKTGLWISFAIAAGGDFLAVYILIISRAHIQRPNIEAWQDDEAPAWVSPPIGAGLRGDGDLRSRVRRARRGRGTGSPRSFEAPTPG